MRRGSACGFRSGGRQGGVGGGRAGRACRACTPAHARVQAVGLARQAARSRDWQEPTAPTAPLSPASQGGEELAVTLPSLSFKFTCPARAGGARRHAPDMEAVEARAAADMVGWVKERGVWDGRATTHAKEESGGERGISKAPDHSSHSFIFRSARLLSVLPDTLPLFNPSPTMTDADVRLFSRWSVEDIEVRGAEGARAGAELAEQKQKGDGGRRGLYVSLGRARQGAASDLGSTPSREGGHTLIWSALERRTGQDRSVRRCERGRAPFRPIREGGGRGRGGESAPAAGGLPPRPHPASWSLAAHPTHATAWLCGYMHCLRACVEHPA